MKIIKRMLKIISLLPLITVLFISILNFKKPISIKLLVWESPKLYIGTWMIIAATTGALVSSASVIGIGNTNQILKRKVKYQYMQEKREFDPQEKDQITEDYISFNDDILPERDLKDPYPILSVPYRIIKEGNNNYSYQNKIDNYTINEMYNKPNKDSSKSDYYQEEEEKNVENNELEESMKNYDYNKEDWLNQSDEEW